MSAWRRVVIEAIPSCKRTIEQASDPWEMWLAIPGELGSCYRQMPPDEAAIRQIYAFALACHRQECRRTYGCEGIEFFFEIVLRDSNEVGKDVSARITESDFYDCEAMLNRWCAPEETAEIKHKFLAAQRKALWEAKESRTVPHSRRYSKKHATESRAAD